MRTHSKEPQPEKQSISGHIWLPAAVLNAAMRKAVDRTDLLILVAVIEAGPSGYQDTNATLGAWVGPNNPIGENHICRRVRKLTDLGFLTSTPLTDYKNGRRLLAVTWNLDGEGR